MEELFENEENQGLIELNQLNFHIERKIEALVKLAEYLQNKEQAEFQDCIQEAKNQNPWFTEDQIYFAVNQIVNEYLIKDKLKSWIENYQIKSVRQQVIALVLAGNIPLVGFHDLLCVYMADHKMQIKLSEKDNKLIPFILKVLSGFDPDFNNKIEYVDRIQNFDAVIATGSNRAGMYFESYFQKYPHIIRKNRNAVAVLNGTETRDDLKGLASDIFTYFGLGCRNVSKLYLPTNYDLESLLEFLHEYNKIILHHKYKNNFDYNYALFMLNKDKFYINGAILVKEDTRIASRIASVHYESYNTIDELEKHLISVQDEIQCVSSLIKLREIETIEFGKCQQPALGQYADGVDTMEFLINL